MDAGQFQLDPILAPPQTETAGIFQPCSDIKNAVTSHPFLQYDKVNRKINTYQWNQLLQAQHLIMCSLPVTLSQSPHFQSFRFSSTVNKRIKTIQVSHNVHPNY